MSRLHLYTKILYSPSNPKKLLFEDGAPAPLMHFSMCHRAAEQLGLKPCIIIENEKMVKNQKDNYMGPNRRCACVLLHQLRHCVAHDNVRDT